jgi:hypothetical protein
MGPWQRYVVECRVGGRSVGVLRVLPRLVTSSSAVVRGRRKRFRRQHFEIRSSLFLPPNTTHLSPTAMAPTLRLAGKTAIITGAGK